MIPTHTQRTFSLRRTATAIAIIGVSVMTLSQTSGATSSSAKGNPPGNNGTIKINGATLQDGPRNVPHVDCVFNLTFSGYDQGDLNATVLFELQAPTLRNSGNQTLLNDTIAIGEDPAGGANDLDASRQYTLDFTGVTPHAKQGYHVKATIHADGSSGADVKHKVFWVAPCKDSTTTTTTRGEGEDTTPTTERETTTTTLKTTTTTAPALTTTTLSPTTTTTQAPKVQGVQQTAPTTAAPTTAAPTQVLGETLTKPATELPHTGSRSADLAFFGGLALALGAALTLLSEATKRRLARHVA